MIDVATLYFWDPKTYEVYASNFFQSNIQYLGTHQHVYNYKSHKTYYPHVELRKYIANYPKALTALLVVKVSLPKLMFGNNLMELTDADFQACCVKLSDVLFQMGIKITSHEVERCADVRGFEYGKNILTGRIPVPFVLNELYRAQPIQHYMDVQRMAYQNGGEKLVFYSSGYELVFYDKTKELQKEIKQPHCQLPKHLKTTILQDQLNILRIELRFHRRKSWQKLLYPYDRMIRQATFRDVFRTNISRNILLDYWHKISDQARKAPIDAFDPAFELWRIANGYKKQLKPQALLAKLGTNYLVRSAGHYEAVRGLKRLGFSNPPDFLKRNTGAVSRINWRMDVWRFIDHALSRFVCLTPAKWAHLKQRVSAVWFKRYESFLTVKDIAQQLNVSTKVIHQEIHRKLLPAYKIGKYLRISRTALATYLNRCLK